MTSERKSEYLELVKEILAEMFVMGLYVPAVILCTAIYIGSRMAS